jgi:hypothetical protein
MSAATRASTKAGEPRSGAYSPGRRTALVLCGTGAHAVYHAGVLRAFQEAGVKIDLVAGQGIGAGSAALAAIDGGARLWEPDGIWRAGRAPGLYAWKIPLRLAAWLAVLLVLVLLIPLIVLAAGLVLYPVGFLLTLLGLTAGGELIAGYSAWLQVAFASANLPTIVPRVVTLVLVALGTVLGVATIAARWRTPARRRSGDGWWWQIIGTPLDADRARTTFIEAIWKLIRGGAALERPAPSAVGRRYAEVLTENVGQPGFRELIAIATDLDARRDVIVALIRDPYRRDFFAPRSGRERRAEVLDLSGVGRDQAIAVIAAALTPPIACDPALVTFSLDSFWRGETHRLCDRPAAIGRLLEEVAESGVTQIIIASAVAETHEPHHLSASRLNLRHRLGDFLAAAECAALRDAIEMAPQRFDAVYLVSPTHNPLGPFDFAGAYDEASDRRHALSELMEQGYEDAYRQFIEPIVGDSGEQLGRTESGGLRLSF